MLISPPKDLVTLRTTLEPVRAASRSQLHHWPTSVNLVQQHTEVMTAKAEFPVIKEFSEIQNSFEKVEAVVFPEERNLKMMTKSNEHIDKTHSEGGFEKCSIGAKSRPIVYRTSAYLT